MKMLVNKIKDLNLKPLVWPILVLAIPAILENILQVLIGVVDTKFVGSLGKYAVAGVSATNLIMNIYIAFFLAISIGTTALITRSIGSGEIEKANKVVKQAFIAASILGVVFGIINLIFSKQILSIIGIDSTVMKYAQPYFISVAVPSIFLCLMMVLSSILRCSGDTVTPMVIALIANIINGVFDYILMFGLFSFSGFGVLGAGLAATLSRVIAVILLILSFKRKTSKLSLNIFTSWKPDLNILKSMMKISLPAAAERLLMRLGQVIYGGMIIQIGVAAYAAHNIAGTIESFSYLPGMGFGVAAATLVGQNLGSKKTKEAEANGWLSYILSSIFMIIIGILFYVFAPFLAKIFIKDAEVIAITIKVLRIIALFQPFLCMTLVTTSALQGAGDTKFPLYTTFIGILIRIVGAYILGIKLNMGLVGVWSAYVIDITIRGSLITLRFIRGKWKNISVKI